MVESSSALPMGHRQGLRGDHTKSVVVTGRQMLLSDRNALCSPMKVWSLSQVREPVPISSEYLMRMARKRTQASLLSPEKAGVKKDQSFGHKSPTRGRFWFPEAALKFDIQESPLF